MTATSNNIPGKRLKTWHRRHLKTGTSVALREYARNFIKSGNADEKRTALSWAKGKVAP